MGSAVPRHHSCGMAWLPGLESVCDRLRQSPVSFEQGSESDDEGDASPYRINSYLRREFGLATPHAALSLSSFPDITVATSPPPPLPPPHLLLDACGLSQMRPLQPNTDLGQLLLEYSGDEGQLCADPDDACGGFNDAPGASMLPRELRSSNLTQCGDAVDIIAPAENMKTFFKLLHCEAAISLAVHRVGNALVLEGLEAVPPSHGGGFAAGGGAAMGGGMGGGGRGGGQLTLQHKALHSRFLTYSMSGDMAGGVAGGTEAAAARGDGRGGKGGAAEAGVDQPLQLDEAVAARHEDGSSSSSDDSDVGEGSNTSPAPCHNPAPCHTPLPCHPPTLAVPHALAVPPSRTAPHPHRATPLSRSRSGCRPRSLREASDACCGGSSRA